MNAAAVSGLEAALAAMKQERAELDSAIKGVEVALVRMRRTAGSDNGLAVSHSQTALLPGLGQYSGKGPTDVIIDILKFSQRPLSAGEIYDFAKAQGFTSTSKNAKNMFRSICVRMEKEGRAETVTEDGKRTYRLKH